jgi:hypothetical protein
MSSFVIYYVADEFVWQVFEQAVYGQVIILAMACPFGGHVAVVDFVDFGVEVFLGGFGEVLHERS